MTYGLLATATQPKVRWVPWGLYVCSLIAIALLLSQRNIFVNPGNPLLATHGKRGARPPRCRARPARPPPHPHLERGGARGAGGRRRRGRPGGGARGPRGCPEWP